VDEAPRQRLLLAEADGLALPHAEAAETVLLADRHEARGDLVERLRQRDLLPAALHPLERREQAVRVIHHVDRGARLHAQTAAVPGVVLVGGDVDDAPVLQVHLDAAAVVAHAAEGAHGRAFGGHVSAPHGPDARGAAS
jgi:hypothetical protein